VMALPVAQRDLQKRGTRLRDAQSMTIAGIADVVGVDPCAPLTRRWRLLPALSASSSFAVVAAADRDQGPLVVYVATKPQPSPRPVDWPRGVGQGYRANRYSLVPPSRDQADFVLKDDDLVDADFHDAAYLIRFELRRVPRAPLVLSIDLGTAPT